MTMGPKEKATSNNNRFGKARLSDETGPPAIAVLSPLLDGRNDQFFCQALRLGDEGRRDGNLETLKHVDDFAGVKITYCGAPCAGQGPQRVTVIDIGCGIDGLPRE